GGNALTAGNGPFAFPAVVPDGSDWTVTVQTKDWSCAVDRGSGTIHAADAADVAVRCSAVSHDATLQDLRLSIAPLVPAFYPGGTTYTASSGLVPDTTTVTATATDPGATIRISSSVPAFAAQSGAAS